MSMIQSHYELLVTEGGRHLFATDARSLTDKASALALAKELMVRFPEVEGYKVTITHVECVGHRVELPQ